MTIKIWQSYACNNSSAYRLVARFSDAKAAADTATELAAFFGTHAQQMDEAMESGDFPDDNPEAAKLLAEQYGFTWDGVLTWGDEMLSGDEPTVASEGRVLAIYHTYCGGFDDLPKYLAARGGTVEEQERDAPTISVLFKWPDNAELATAWDSIVGQIDPDDDTADEIEFKAPWGGRERYGRLAAFRDAGTAGVYCPIDPSEIAGLKTWLADHGVTAPSLTLCEYGDAMTFSGVRTARCTACGGPLLYLDPRIHDIEKPQLQCSPCGGLYDLEAFPPKPE